MAPGIKVSIYYKGISVAGFWVEDEKGVQEILDKAAEDLDIDVVQTLEVKGGPEPTVDGIRVKPVILIWITYIKRNTIWTTYIKRSTRWRVICSSNFEPEKAKSLSGKELM